MNLITHTLLQEKRRIENMLARYQAELDTLPKGTLSEKHVGQRTYYYLKYRDGKKVISQYVKSDDLEQLQNQLDKRRHIEGMLASLQEEKEIADRALEGIS